MTPLSCAPVASGPVRRLIQSIIVGTCLSLSTWAGAASHAESPQKCRISPVPSPETLPTIELLPNPFVDSDGKPITDHAQWLCQREQLKQQLFAYETGVKPPQPELVRGQINTDELTINVRHAGRDIHVTAGLTLPASGEPPYPVIIGVGLSSLNNEALSRQGVAVIRFDNNAMGAQAGMDSRGSGLFFDLYGTEHSASALTAWAWGISRVIDVIENDEGMLLDADRIGVTGCSRNGKGALLAGALDDRIALTIPQESGAGGAVSWRVSQALSERGENTQTLGHAAGEQPWFRASFGQDFGERNVTRLPFDHHQLMGLVAPRGLLVLDNDIDWLGPRSSYIATVAARRIYRALGVEDHLAYSENGEHTHCQLPDNQQPLVDAFVQRFLLEKTGETDVMRSTQADRSAASAWIDWETPDLTVERPR